MKRISAGVDMHVLKDDKRREIFKQFLYSKRMKFSEIEKQTGIRSNELAYFLQKMIDEGLIVKRGVSKNSEYSLTKEAEKYIPFFAENDELSPLSVVLVACRDKEGRFLLKYRTKRPYESHWSLVGARIRLDETIEKASVRAMKEKTFLDVKFRSINAVVHEKHSEKGEIKSAFVLFFVLVEPMSNIKEKEDLKWYSLDEVKKLKMIPSDNWLLLNKLDSEVAVVQETINDDESSLSMDIENIDR